MTPTHPARDPNLVFVGMPTLDGNMTEPTRALFDLVGDGKKLGPYTFITRKVVSYDTATARNIITALAMQTNAGRLLMLDADMNAGREHVLRILSHHGTAIVGGAYPKKELSLLQKWVCNVMEKAQPSGLAPAFDVGAGFMSIDMNVVESMIADNPGLEFLSEYPQSRGETFFALWDPMVVTDDWGLTGKWSRRLTDDFAFCYRARKAGFAVFVDTQCTVGHVGPVDFLQVMTMIEQLTGQAAEPGERKG